MAETATVERYAVVWQTRWHKESQMNFCVVSELYQTTACNEDFAKMIGIKRGYAPSEITIVRFVLMPEDSDLVTLREFKWTDDLSYQRALTCANHRYLRWGTKNPFERNMHYMDQLWHPECKCSMGDLRVIVSLSQCPHWERCLHAEPTK